MSSAVPPAQGTDGPADPAAGAALVPEADPAIADPGHGRTADPSLAPPGTRKPRHTLVPGLDPSPGQSQGLEAILLHPKESPGLDLRVSPSLQLKMEVIFHRAQNIRIW